MHARTGIKTDKGLQEDSNVNLGLIRLETILDI